MTEHGDGSRESPYHGLEGIVRLIEDTAHGALKYEKLTDGDRTELLWAMPVLRGAIQETIKILDRAPYSHLSEHGRSELLRALGAAFVIGSRGNVSESSEIFARIKKQSDAGGRKRPKGVSPFTEFFEKRLRRGLPSKLIEEQLLDHARSGGGDFEFSETEQAIVSVGERLHKLRISSISSAISKARKKIG